MFGSRQEKSAVRQEDHLFSGIEIRSHQNINLNGSFPPAHSSCCFQCDRWIDRDEERTKFLF